MSAALRVILADDESHVRRALRDALGGEEGVEIVAEAADGPEAVSAVERHRPDVLFLDVRMPGADGFDVLDAISRPRPWVVFVTAHDEYALRAFEAHAVDYLLKPFDDGRVRRAIARARTMVRGTGREALEGRVRELLEAVLRPPGGGRIAVRVGTRTILLAAEEIDHVEADGNYVRIFADGRTHVARRTLSEMADELGESFVRIHRSRLVRFDRVREVRATDGVGCVVVLADGTRLEVSESGRRRLESRMDRV